jgi:hypothetical protein
MTHTERVAVSLLADDEIPASFRVLSKSFGHDAPFIDIYFPNHDTPSGQAHGSNRLLAWKQASKTSTFLAGEGNKDHIIGIAVWSLEKEPPSGVLEDVADVEEVWPNEEDREFMARVWREFGKPRTDAINNSRGEGVHSKLNQQRIVEYRFSYLICSSRTASGRSRLSKVWCRQSSR